MELIFEEDGYIVKTLETPEELEASFRLRHDVFCDELRWVLPSPDRIEKDHYDGFAHPIGVFSEDLDLVGHVRLISGMNPFMIEKEFSCLLPPNRHFKKLTNMAESTRICIRKDFRTIKHNSMTLAHLLYKAMYHWCLINDVRYLVTIVEKRYYLLLKRSKFPFHPIGDFLPLGDGVLSGIIISDWREVERVLPEKRADFFGWLTNLQALEHKRLQRHALY